MEHLFSVWPEIAERVRNAGQVLLLTDFDGTLSPIAGRPEEAVLPDDTRQALEVLASTPAGRGWQWSAAGPSGTSRRRWESGG